MIKGRNESFLRIISVIAAICVPVAAILGASNLILRLPDLILMNLEANKSSGNQSFISDDELGQFFQTI